MKKILITVTSTLFVIIVVLLLARNIIVKSAVTRGVKAVTGLELNIDQIDIGLFKTHFGIQGLKLHNSSSFKDKIMIDLPEIFVDYDLGSFLKGNTHLEEIRLDLKEFVVVKNENGELNLDALNVSKSGKKKEKTQPETEKESGSLLIDILYLKIGKVIYKDYSKGTEPEVKTYDVNIEETYENITSPQQLTSTIVMKALMKTKIANLTNFNMRALKQDAAQVLEDATSKIGEGAKGIGGKAKDIIDGTSAKDKIKKLLPFGGKKE